MASPQQENRAQSKYATDYNSLSPQQKEQVDVYVSAVYGQSALKDEAEAPYILDSRGVAINRETGETIYDLPPKPVSVQVDFRDPYAASTGVGVKPPPNAVDVSGNGTFYELKLEDGRILQYEFAGVDPKSGEPRFTVTPYKPSTPAATGANLRSFALGGGDYMVVNEDTGQEVYRVTNGVVIRSPTYQGAMPTTGMGTQTAMGTPGAAPGTAVGEMTNWEDGSVGPRRAPPPRPQNQGWSTYNGQRIQGQIDWNRSDPGLPPVPEASANAGATSNSIYWNAQPRIPRPGEDDTQPGFYTDRSKVGPGATPYHKSDGPKFGTREYTQMLANYARGGDPDRSSMFPNTRQPVSRTGLATYQRMAEASQDFAQRTPYERGEVDHLGNRWLANGGSMISSDPIAFVNMRTKRPIAVSSEYGQPERIDVTPMDNTPAMMATGGTMFSGVSSPDRWRRSGASNDGDWESRDRPRISYPEAPLPSDATAPGAPSSPPLPPAVPAPPMPTPPINPSPLPGAPPAPAPAPIDPMQDAIRRAYEARQRAKMAYRYSMAGLPSPYGVSLSELPPGLFWEDDLPAQLPPDHPSNQPPPGTTPSPTPNQPNVPAIGPGEHPAEYINRLVRGGYFSTETAAGQWYQQQPKTPKVGDTPIPNDPLAFLAAKLFGDRRAA